MGDAEMGQKEGQMIYSMIVGTYAETHEYGKIKAPALAFFAIGYQKDVDRAETLPEPQRQNVQKFLKAQRKYHEQEIEHFRKQIPSARVVVLTNADHACFIHRQDEVLREMREFLSPAGSRSHKASFPPWVDLQIQLGNWKPPPTVKADKRRKEIPIENAVVRFP